MRIARTPLVVVVPLAVVVACAAIVAVKAKDAPGGPPSHPSPLAERAYFATNIEANEDEWRRLSAENFPGDNWSQSDDFHSREASRIRELARERKAPFEEVLRAIDEDLHHGAGTKENERRKAEAVPCKPRPFYD